MKPEDVINAIGADVVTEVMAQRARDRGEGGLVDRLKARFRRGRREG